MVPELNKNNSKYFKERNGYMQKVSQIECTTDDHDQELFYVELERSNSKLN